MYIISIVRVISYSGTGSSVARITVMKILMMVDDDVVRIIMMVRRMVASAMMAIMISICVDTHTQILIRNAHGIIFLWDSRQMFAPNCSYQDYQCFGHQCEQPSARMNTTKTSQLTMPIHISWSSRRFESSQADHIYKDTGKYRLIKHKYPSKSCPRDLDSSQLQRFKTSLSSKHFLSTARIAEPGHGDQPKKTCLQYLSVHTQIMHE